MTYEIFIVQLILVMYGITDYPEVATTELLYKIASNNKIAAIKMIRSLADSYPGLLQTKKAIEKVQESFDNSYDIWRQ